MPKKDLSPELPNSNRREFLVSASSTVAAGVIAAYAPANAGVWAADESTAVRTDGLAIEGMVPIALRINGKDHQLRLDPRTTLLDCLRETVALTGTRKGCDHGQCGACTVHVNGRRVLSCLNLALLHDGNEITTIEGLAKDGVLHPVQEGFWECHGLQCGYCTPGMILAGAQLLQRNPKPTRQEIAHALEGNLCRCTGYSHITDAIDYAAKKMARKKR